MRHRAILPLLALAFGSVTLLLHAEKVKKTPIRPTLASSGVDMYNEYCAVCHGKSGKGDGPAAPALNKPPSNLTLLAMNNHGKFPVMKVAEAIRGDFETPAHGSKDMPVWGKLFSDMTSYGNQAEVHLRISNLTNYVATLQEK
jgi:mono/diheme cytochrome c family protein